MFPSDQASASFSLASQDFVVDLVGGIVMHQFKGVGGCQNM
jgi:hypothetical protein